MRFHLDLIGNYTELREHPLFNDVRFFFGGGSSKMGQNRTWGVGSFLKIGHPIILVILQSFCFQKHNVYFLLPFEIVSLLALLQIGFICQN